MAVLALYGAAEISRQLPGLQDVMEEAQPQPAAQHLVGGGRLVHLAQRLASGPGDIAIQGEQRVPFRGREVLQVDAPVADVGREALHVLRNHDEKIGRAWCRERWCQYV